MTFNPLFKKVVLGAAEATLDVAGAAVLPGAWPILKKAMEPVLERLKERFGGESVTASPEQAKKAVEEFESDSHLQEILRSNLLEQLDDLVQGQQEISGDVQKLMLIASGDRALLEELVGGVERIEERLEEGVDLSDEAIEKVTALLAREAEDSRQVRALALRAMGPVAKLAERQVSRLQVRAVELIQQGDLDRADDELREGLMLIAALLAEAPTDFNLRLQLGFLYKAMAQVQSATGNEEGAELYIQQAERIFRLIKNRAVETPELALQVANAVHGLGNVHQQRQDFRSAIENYELSTSLYPDHSYSWHDIFASHYELARRGEKPDLEAMHHALDMVKKTGKGQPGLGVQHLAQLEAVLKGLEAQAGGGPEHSPRRRHR